MKKFIKEHWLDFLMMSFWCVSLFVSLYRKKQLDLILDCTMFLFCVIIFLGKVIRDDIQDYFVILSEFYLRQAIHENDKKRNQEQGHADNEQQPQNEGRAEG